MPKLKIMHLLFCIAAISYCMLSSEAAGGGSRSGGSGKGGSRQYRQTKGFGYYNGAADPYGRPPPTTDVKKAQRGGLSGWAVISITLFVLFIGFSLYYFYLLYPIYCKKQRSYNTIELVNV